MINFYTSLVLILLGVFFLEKWFNQPRVSELIEVVPNTNQRPVQQANTLVDGMATRDPFAWLNQDVSQGNPISWSGKPNATTPFRPGQSSLCGSLQKQAESLRSKSGGSEVVIQGHTVPLAHQLYPSRQEVPSIVPFANLRVSPACCPSTYSTDSGCVCGL